MKRYQECNNFIKFWRNRWMIVAWFSFIFNYIKSPLFNREEISIMWSCVKGQYQIDKMKFYYTHEEVMNVSKKWKKNNMRNGKYKKY